MSEKDVLHPDSMLAMAAASGKSSLPVLPGQQDKAHQLQSHTDLITLLQAGNPSLASVHDQAATQLLASFPGTPASSEMGQFLRLSSDSSTGSIPVPATTQAQASCRTPKAAMHKRSRLHRASHFSDEEDFSFSAPASTKRYNSLSSPGPVPEDELTDIEAACVLMQLAHASYHTPYLQQPRLSALQDTPSWIPRDLVAVAATAAAALAAHPSFTPAECIQACNSLAKFHSAKDAEQKARVGLSLGTAQARCEAAQDTAQSTPTASGLTRFAYAWSSPITPSSTSPFAAVANLHTAPNSSMAAQGASGDDVNTAFASIWALQSTLQAQLPAIRPKSNLKQPCLSHASPAAAAAATGAGFADDFLQPADGLPDPNVSPVTPPSAKQPSRKRRLHTFMNDQSSFARQAADNVSAETQADLRAHWEAYGRVAVTCGPAGSRGICGIFTLKEDGKPVVWTPVDSIAVARLHSLASTARGGSEAPVGFEEVEPKVFEEMGGMGKSRNFQQSIAVAGFSSCVAASPSGRPRKPFVIKLGHFARICGVGFAKQ